MIENHFSPLRLMRRIFMPLVAFFAVTALGVLPAGAEMTKPVSLKSHISVEGRFITLGDLFMQAGEAAHVIVGDAPAPGRRLVFEARRLAAFSAQHGLTWKNTARLDRVFIQRASHKITTSVILQAVTQALENEAGPGALEIELSDRNVKLDVPSHFGDRVAITDLSYDPASGYFEAVLSAGGDDPESVSTHISGRAYQAFDVPTLKRAHRAGDVIEAGDVEWKRLRQNRIGRTVITNEADLVGMSLKRRIAQGQPLRKSDVERPIIVNSGALITLIYRSPGIMLTAEGRTLSKGGTGDVIRVINTQSKRTVQATVTSSHEAVVADFSNQVSLNP